MEVGLLGTPMVVVYKVSRLTSWIGRALVRSPHISLVNLVFGRAVVPEVLQGRATAAVLGRMAGDLLNDPARLERISARLGYTARAPRRKRGEWPRGGGRGERNGQREDCEPVKSMTGFGQADAENEECRVAVSVRSVNHRFLDLAIRLAEEYRDLEPELRKILDRRVARGRVELRVAVELFDEGAPAVSLDQAVVAGLLKAARDLEGMGLATGDLAAGDLLRLPDVVRVRRRPGTLGDEGRRLIFDTVDQALDQLLATRETEGAQLGSFSSFDWRISRPS